MKHYQDSDPLHGHGKAMPHAKAPNPQQYVSRFFRKQPHPLTVKEFRIKPSRQQRINEHQRKKSAFRRATKAGRN